MYHINLFTIFLFSNNAEVSRINLSLAFKSTSDTDKLNLLPLVTSLKSLDISNCQLEQFPSWVKQMYDLVELRMWVTIAELNCFQNEVKIFPQAVKN